jgi:serine/threonine-protein kinase
MLYLADCYEKLGRTASAWALFREASSEARAAGQTARAESGAARAAALEPKLSKLSLQVDPENLIPGFELLRDGQLVGRGVYGVAVPVDPGEHRLEARAPGRLPWTAVQRVGPDGDSVVATVPQLPPDSSVAATPAEPAATPARPETAPSSEPGAQRSVQRTAGLVAGGVGVVALGVGAFFGARAISKNDDAKGACNDSTTCPTQKGEDLSDEAQSAATLSNVFVIGGAALAATGVVLYLTAPSSEAPAAALSTDGQSLRLSVRGVF